MTKLCSSHNVTHFTSLPMLSICGECGQYFMNVDNSRRMWSICGECGQYVGNAVNIVYVIDL